MPVKPPKPYVKTHLTPEGQRKIDAILAVIERHPGLAVGPLQELITAANPDISGKLADYYLRRMRNEGRVRFGPAIRDPNRRGTIGRRYWSVNHFPDAAAAVVEVEIDASVETEPAAPSPCRATRRVRTRMNPSLAILGVALALSVGSRR